jgi:hypothetical protein
MGLTFTPVNSYHEINVEETDLFEDAWGFNADYCDVISFLGKIDPDPGDRLTNRVIEMISKQS